VEAIYRYLLSQISAKGKPVRLGDYSKDYAQVLKTDGEVSAPFTKAGAAQMLHQIDAGNWADECIIGRGPAAGDNQLKATLRKKYKDAYIDAWRKFLADIRVAAYGTARVAVQKLGALSEKDSPILAALFMTRENTNFSPEEGRSDPSLTEIRTAFQPVRILLPDSARIDFYWGAENEPYLEALSTLQKAMGRLSNSDPSVTSPREACGEGLEEVKRIAARFDQPEVQKEVRQLLEQPIQAAQSLPPPDSGLQGALDDLCRIVDRLRQKKPFNPRGKDEVRQDELAGVFARPAGKLWTFHSEKLASLVQETSGHHWERRPGATPRVSDKLVAWFDKLARISTALFKPNVNKPEMDYEIRVDKPGNVDTLTFDAGDGRHDPGEYKLSWPGSSKFELTTAPGATMANWKGLWSLFFMAYRAGHRGEGVLVLDCNFAPESNDCTPVTGNGGGPVSVLIHVVRYPNGVEESLDKNFLTLGACPTAIDRSEARVR